GRLVRDSLYNAIISHGHPRAILGAVLSGLSVSYVLGSRDVTARHFIQFLQHQIESLDLDETGDQNISSWIDDWEGGKENGNGNGNFSTIFTQTRREAYKHISAIGKYIDRSTREYYSLVGALDPSTKGSGIATVCAALYVFLRHLDDPHEAIYDAVNQIGSDTDTIASLAGALVGAHLGKSAVPEHLYQRVQDRAYLERMASHLFFIAFSDETQDRILPDSSVQKAGREEIYLKMLAWEIGLHEMFWDALSQGSPISHPALGQGVVRGKWERGVIREGYEAKLIRVEFDCGQSCIFHSRVKNDREVSVSLSRPLERAIYGRRKKTLDISEEI
ncbi:MAG: ADP-ribosylglycohydrolase family protein, partial [Pirellulales bacterium]|nr:ADP-ribosylglycohydrolase family protein [Pirellulales bacterium]